MASTEDDSVLLGYLSSLLTSHEPVVEPIEEPLACLKVDVGGQALLLPLSELSGMQAVCGPLVRHSEHMWRLNEYGDDVFLDMRQELDLQAVDYSQRNWTGHSLKLKQLKQALLVDAILGPQKSTNHQIWQKFNGVRYTLVVQ